ncbi:Type 1 glutamine amidotransferase-like domain-containing protein [Halobacillus sp. A5]|uniref:Type 1 glutamine amidotransferase-like domain-containing protein n=1 Tax=Halobacillus sp. A5 TaxID=2880263 RepID=UPI0020A6C22D|nr:Type 1 glutamine amidotransferase-like domain-containing protein [Halobacillus sp. A5]MCP3026465.1 Type 1 glutamine amidotransferase-like domain-containing protein [Halobacillus sp. A5]
MVNKNGTLILCGGGDAGETMRINQYFSNIIDTARPLLYIPLAGDLKKRSYEESYDYTYNLFRDYGVREVVMWTDLRDKSYGDLHSFSSIYLSGGSALQLLKTIRESEFEEVLLAYYQNGGILYGQSAGAIIFGKYINSVDHNCPERGMNLVEGIWCHYKPEDDDKVMSFAKRLESSVLAISDGAAVVCRGNRSFAIGADSVYIFNKNGKKVIGRQ